MIYSESTQTTKQFISIHWQSPMHMRRVYMLYTKLEPTHKCARYLFRSIRVSVEEYSVIFAWFCATLALHWHISSENSNFHTIFSCVCVCVYSVISNPSIHAFSAYMRIFRGICATQCRLIPLCRYILMASKDEMAHEIRSKQKFQFTKWHCKAGRQADTYISWLHILTHVNY